MRFPFSFAAVAHVLAKGCIGQGRLVVRFGR